MVELRTRKRDMRGDGGNHHEKLGLMRISCASQFTIPDTAGTSPDPAGNITDTRSSQSNQASRTPDFSYPLVSSISFSSSSPIQCSKRAGPDVFRPGLRALYQVWLAALRAGFAGEKPGRPASPSGPSDRSRFMSAGGTHTLKMS
jgi:hypothetical protein